MTSMSCSVRVRAWKCEAAHDRPSSCSRPRNDPMTTLARHFFFVFLVAPFVSAAGLVACDGSSSDQPVVSDNAATNTDTSSQEKLICDAYASRSACQDGAIPCEAYDKCIYGKVMLLAA